MQHEGIDADRLRPDLQASITTPNGQTLRAGDPVVTYVARNLEPYRGFHVFMRALPEMLRQRPNARVLIIGSGMSYHNLREFFSHDEGPCAAAKSFDDWLTQTVLLEDVASRDSRLCDWRNAPGAKASHPTPEHLEPLFVIAGAVTSQQSDSEYETVSRTPAQGIQDGVDAERLAQLLDEALALDLPNITRFVVSEVAERLENGARPIPFMRFLNGARRLEHL